MILRGEYKSMSEHVRGFEVVSKYKEESIDLPARATIGSAGYDLKAAKDTVVPSILESIIST